MLEIVDVGDKLEMLASSNCQDYKVIKIMLSQIPLKSPEPFAQNAVQSWYIDDGITFDIFHSIEFKLMTQQVPNGTPCWKYL